MFSSISNWFKAEINGVKRYAIYTSGVAKAVIHGGWSSLTSVLAASILDYSKFNLTSGLKSEFDMLVMVFMASGGLAGYLYVKQNSVPKA